MAAPYLIGKFFYELWASPWQDNQSIMQPKRITPLGGKRNNATIFDCDYRLPEKITKFHIYQMGQFKPDTFNLPNTHWMDMGRWVKLVDWVKQSKVTFKFYLDNGLVIPMSHIWFMVTEDKNLVFAIKEDLTLKWDMDKQTVNFHTYRNGVLAIWDETQKKAEVVDVAYVKLKRQSDRQPLLDFNRKYSAMAGQVFCYVNGYLVDSIITTPTVEGDVVELIYDSTITKSIEIELESLNVYTSIRDQVRKYLFSHPNSFKNNILEYFDDLDFYVLIRPHHAPKRFYGVLFHRNDVKNVRQVTNCDYGLNTNVVQNVIDNHKQFQEQNGKLSIVAYYRKQWKSQKMLYVHNRLHELNKLPYKNRLAAMVGLVSNIPEWRADQLENSWLMKGIGLPHAVCDLAIVEQVFGYNAIAYYAGKAMWSTEEAIPFDKKFPDNRYIDVPHAIRPYSTVFEYDSLGKMLSYARFGDYQQYPIKNQGYPTTPSVGAHFIEFIPGVGTRQPDDRLNQVETDVEGHFGWRMYACEKSLESYPEEWKDVTDDKTFTASWVSTDGRNMRTVKFLKDPALWTFFVRTDRDFLCREFDVGINRGIIQFPIMQYFREGNDNVYLSEMLVPYGQLDVFMNGRSMVEGIDFFVNFPNITIVNKHWLKQGLTQRVMIRYMDFCTKDLGSVTHREVGYLNHSQLSRNGQYNIFEDKNFIYKLAGGMCSYNHIGTAEQDKNSQIWLDREGYPYEVRDVIVPNRKIYNHETYSFREEAFDLDKRIGDYMGQFLKEKPKPNPTPTIQRFRLYSPVLSVLMDDMRLGKFTFPDVDTRYVNQDVIDFMESHYAEFFKVDPYFQDQLVDKFRCHIQPSIRLGVVNMSFNHYRFLRTVISIYFHNEVETTNFITVEK